jgi:AcrR family transcriptional regulator
MNSSSQLLDLRVRRTYKFLWEALLALMAEQDFESITVTDICERAMVHRTTFYKHYEDKYGLLYHGMHDELNALFASLKLPVDQPVDVKDAAKGVAHLVIMFEHILAHERFYRLMLAGDGIGKFYALWRRSLADHLEKLFTHQLQWDEQRAAVPIALRTQFHAGALISVIAWWLDHNCQHTPDELAR